MVASTFIEDGSYKGSIDSDPFIITQEDARMTYTGSLMVATPSATATTAPVVTLRATIRDITAVIGDPAFDSHPGDIRLAKARFIDENGNGISGWLTPTLVSNGDLKTGVISFDWTNVAEGAYTVGIEVSSNGYYIRQNPDVSVVANVYQPTGDFITGGGYIIPTVTAGTFAADAGLKTNFGFNVKYNKKGTNLQGNMNFIFRRMENDGIHTYQIKANAMTSLGVNISSSTSQTAEFVSKANLTDITNPLNPIAHGGNKTLQVSLTDNGEPGANDMIAISLYDGSTLMYSCNWNGANTAKMLLGGGNLVVHSSFSLGGTTTSPSGPGKKSAEITTSTGGLTVEPMLKAYPNPFTDRLTIEFSPVIDTQAKLEIFSITGAKLETLFEGPVNAGVLYKYEYQPRLVSSQIVLYHLTLDGKIQVGKIMYNERK
jgi:hypothetical protein